MYLLHHAPSLRVLPTIAPTTPTSKDIHADIYASPLFPVCFHLTSTHCTSNLEKKWRRNETMTEPNPTKRGRKMKRKSGLTPSPRVYYSVPFRSVLFLCISSSPLPSFPLFSFPPPCGLACEVRCSQPAPATKNPS